MKNGLLSERLNIYLQTKYKTTAGSTIGSWRALTGSCGDGKFHMFPFLKVFEENKSLKKLYEHYFIDKFKSFLNKKNEVAKDRIIAILSRTTTDTWTKSDK